MSQEKNTIKSFTDLVAWQKSHVFAVAVYKNTVDFPSSEQFGLTNQLRRSAYSVTSNIAEGFGRRTVPDRLHFYDMARASLAEAQSQLLLARDIGFLKNESFDTLAEKSITSSRKNMHYLTKF